MQSDKGNNVKRSAYLMAGLSSLLLGTLGILLPILPTVPFIILAAFCFARSSPALELKLVRHPAFGAHIEAWRIDGAISRKGKRAAYATFIMSAVFGIVLLEGPISLVPAVAAILGAVWISSRPDSHTLHSVPILSPARYRSDS